MNWRMDEKWFEIWWNDGFASLPWQMYPMEITSDRLWLNAGNTKNCAHRNSWKKRTKNNNRNRLSDKKSDCMQARASIIYLLFSIWPFTCSMDVENVACVNAISVRTSSKPFTGCHQLCWLRWYDTNDDDAEDDGRTMDAVNNFALEMVVRFATFFPSAEYK